MSRKYRYFDDNLDFLTLHGRKEIEGDLEFREEEEEEKEEDKPVV